MNRIEAIRSAALLAYVETMPQTSHGAKHAEAMNLHEIGVIHDQPQLLAEPTGLTACSELHYALYQIDYCTARAMVADMQRCPGTADMFRAKAAKWVVYFEDAERNRKAGDEDDARCANAEAAEARRFEENYR